jgi:anti-sigma regulatory factor (Ser/Thr protein kinase)
MNEPHSIRIRNSMTEVASALDDAANWIEPLQVSAKAQYFLSLAIEELATNWIKYGCRDTVAHSMTFDLGVRDGRLTLIATDDGFPFNPMDAPAPSTGLPLEERDPGGLGILLLRKMADEMSYEHLDGLNILTLEKALH